MAVARSVPLQQPDRGATAFAVIAGISVSHLLNDTVQSIVPAIYPMLKESFALNFAQVGLMTLTLQLTASLLQPLVGLYADRRPTPYALVVGMGFTLVGLLLLAGAPTYGIVLAAAGLMGIGSAVFHPESSRVARMASGGRPGLAQSIFQVGGNVGSSFGPLLAAFLIVPHGQRSIAWCSLLAVLAMAILWRIGGWYRTRHVVTSVSATSLDATRAIPSANPPQDCHRSTRTRTLMRASRAGAWRGRSQFCARCFSRSISTWRA